MAATLTQGTIEYLLVTWDDDLNNITTLAGMGATFDVKDIPASGSPNAYITGASSALVVGMDQYCLIDTTTSPGGSPSAGGLWKAGTYNIWVKLTTPPGLERPKKGPFPFEVQV